MSGHSTYVDPTIFDARLTIAAFVVSNGKHIPIITIDFDAWLNKEQFRTPEFQNSRLSVTTDLRVVYVSIC